MRKLTVLLAATMLLALTAGFAVGLEVGDQPAVSVREGDVRSAPGFLSTITAKVAYGGGVSILELRGDWARVRVVDTGAEGWLHVSAVAEKEALRLGQATGSSSGGTTSREIALAGRGFNEQVEAQYRSEKGLDFALVDQMEGYGQPVDSLGTFFAEAGLSFGEGGTE